MASIFNIFKNNKNNRFLPFLTFSWNTLIRQNRITALKVSVFGVFLVCIFPYSDRIQRDASVRMRENTDQEISECGHFSRNAISLKSVQQLVNQLMSKIKMYIPKCQKCSKYREPHYSPSLSKNILQ